MAQDQSEWDQQPPPLQFAFTLFLIGSQSGMIIPFRSMALISREPRSNYILILLILLFSILGFADDQALHWMRLDGPFWAPGLLLYWLIQPGIFALIGNILFLWVFGNAICSRLSDTAYAGLFLLFAALGGVIMTFASPQESSGAATAINGVVGMYAFSFPRNKIRIAMLFLRIRTIDLPGLVVILGWLLYDGMACFLVYGAGVYLVHLAGFTLGFGVAAIVHRGGFFRIEPTDRPLFSRIASQRHR